ncbi:MAG: DUF4446 family protein [Patescibacteria group bacterium]|nr:DUF4446 family protein [Patescibacteria group bacterium]
MASLTTDPLFIAVVALAAAVLVLAVAVGALWMKLKRFLVGSGASDLEGSLRAVTSDLSALRAFREEIEGYLATVERRLKKSVQSVHTVRFNPFKGTGGGGNQSFATAFLTESGDGVIVSSLYSRDHVSVFAKPVKRGSSEHELSDEEREALEESMKGVA